MFIYLLKEVRRLAVLTEVCAFWPSGEVVGRRSCTIDLNVLQLSIHIHWRHLTCLKTAKKMCKPVDVLGRHYLPSFRNWRNFLYQKLMHVLVPFLSFFKFVFAYLNSINHFCWAFLPTRPDTLQHATLCLVCISEQEVTKGWNSIIQWRANL